MSCDVVLYTYLDCVQCELSKNALTVRGIEFTERSGVDYASALARKGFALAPVLSVAIENELVAWEGHRADLIELLADLLDTGVVPADGLRDMHDAEGAVLTRLQVIQEIRHHQLSTDEFFADHGNHPLYRGSVVLGWLGY